ncbi:MAG: hypothetical protein ACOCSO_01350 [Thermoplasmatota archaeon]
MIVEVMNIIAGLVLCAGILPAIPAMGKYLERLSRWRVLPDHNRHNRHHRRYLGPSLSGSLKPFIIFLS